MKTILKAMFLLCVAGLPLSTIHAQKKEIIDDEAPNKSGKTRRAA